MRNYELENKAYDIAISAHGTQVRKNGELYVSHPLNVALIVESFKESKELSNLIAAAYLHDCLEDTDLTIEKIKLFLVILLHNWFVN